MKYFLIFIGILIFGPIFGQDDNTTDFLEGIKKYDISSLWTLRKFKVEDDPVFKDSVVFAEPLGYIGNDYQRFNIHFISVIQNPTNKLEYLVYGKTRVKTNVCSFQGRIIIKESKIFIDGDLPPFKQGYVRGDYEFLEDPHQKGSGILKGGYFETSFYINKEDNINYDTLNLGADGYSNNQFAGYWISYVGDQKKICNWGDYRIPGWNDLDVGTGEFMINDKYKQGHGWENWVSAYQTDLLGESPEAIKAQQIEKQEWWK